LKEISKAEKYVRGVENRATLANQAVHLNKEQPVAAAEKNLIQRINTKVLDRKNSKEESRDAYKPLRIKRRKISWEESANGDNDGEQSNADRFFENFDKNYRFYEGIKEVAVENPQPAKICRTLLTDFDYIYVQSTQESENGGDLENLLAKPLSRREKPHLETIWDNNEIHRQNLEAVRNADTAKAGDNFKLERLPNIKVSTSKPSSFSRLSNDGSNLFDKINRLHENFILKSRPVRVSNKSNFNADPVAAAVKVSERTLENILRNKKTDNYLRSLTMNTDESRDASFRPSASNRNDEIRSRVHSFQHLDENIRRKVLQKPDLSLDTENDSRIKVVLKGLEQKSTNHYFGINRCRNEVRNQHETCISSRSLYHQENQSALSNSYHERYLGEFERRGTIGASILSTKNDDPFGLYEKQPNREMVNLYKGLKNNIRTSAAENRSRLSYLNSSSTAAADFVAENHTLAKQRR